jgi:hypothetical protein
MRFFSRVIPLLFILLGSTVFVLGARGLIRARASEGWPTAEGTVVSSGVEQKRSAGRRRRGGGRTYHAEIVYEFTVDGTPFKGTRVAYGDFGTSRSAHARRIADRYPPGTPVTVHYMEDDPEECVLEPGMKAQALALPGFGLVFAAVGIFAVTRKVRRDTGPPS